MPTVVPAIKGRMGEMDYYMISMKASELIQIVKTPKDLDVWDNSSIENRYQREIKLNRVKEQLAPYWAENKNHFFGSIIVAPVSFNPDDLNNKFESIGKVATEDVLNLYKEAAINIGFLTLPGELSFVPLDGQHRVKAIDIAINGKLTRKDGEEEIVNSIKSNPDLGKEDISVLLVAVDTKKARSIFTHVNRYARKTSAGEHYITSDDDILAVISREIANDVFTARLVQYKKSTLGTKDPYFTTLSTIYNCLSEMAKDTLNDKLDTAKLPDNETQEILRKRAHHIWKKLVDGIEHYKIALADKSEDGDDNRRELRGEGRSLLARPVAQECLFRAFLKLTGSPTNYSENDAIARLNTIPWDITRESSEQIWQNILWSGGVEDGKMVTKYRALATDIIYHLAGGKLENPGDVLDQYSALFSDEQKPKNLPSL